jgi:hypothetical protein
MVGQGRGEVPDSVWVGRVRKLLGSRGVVRWGDEPRPRYCSGVLRACAILAAATAAFAVSLATAASLATPRVSSLRTLSPPSKLPADYVHAVDHLAAYVGISRGTAVRRTRLLLSDVTGLPLYAFAGTAGRVCFQVWRGAGTCGEITRTHTAIWAMNGGSRKRGQAVVGVVSDSVHAVNIRIGGRTFRVRVRHNAFVLPYRVKNRWPRVSVLPIVR